MLPLDALAAAFKIEDLSCTASLHRLVSASHENVTDSTTLPLFNAYRTVLTIESAFLNEDVTLCRCKAM